LSFFPGLKAFGAVRASIGTSAVALFGTVVGTMTGNRDEQRLMDVCMQAKGYQPA
jgi:hypothetical protein